MADLAWLATHDAERRHYPVRCTNRPFHCHEEADCPLDAVPAMPLALTAGAFADMEVFQNHRIAQFQDLRIGEPGIGHVRMHSRSAVETRSSRRAGANGFIILIG